MAMSLSTTVRSLLIGAVGVVVGVSLSVALPADASVHGSSTPARGHHHPGRYDDRPVGAGSGYLALGDSVTFGFREQANTPTPNYLDAASFVGYPEDVAAELKLHTANAACPGETSASLIDASAPSNGCETAVGGTGPGYRAFPLHVSYRGSQLAYAVRYLRTHRNTRLVSLMIGANDGFLCQETTADGCASELPGVLAKVRTNVAKILATVRGAGHYRGQIVILNYYSLDYSSPAQTASSQGLNQAMDAGAKPFHVRIADGYGAFQKAALQAGGDSCKAGLLTTLTTGGCGVHPSVAGQELLAGAVERAARTR